MCFSVFFWQKSRVKPEYLLIRIKKKKEVKEKCYVRRAMVERGHKEWAVFSPKSILSPKKIYTYL